MAGIDRTARAAEQETTVLPGTPEVDLTGAEKAAKEFLTALGMRTDRPELSETPGRMARAYAELFSPRPFPALATPR
ncbi:hypothetical protein ACIGXM_19885 [Kitasatospora sp. NPDC052896]|uniref:hypothetical protein n=1 Tax=Kitasatospora sp. NPDC052896 TaxID=3364061 RepID=UPI0037C6C58C